MAQCNGAAIDVHAVRIEPQLGRDRQALRREGLVDFPEVDIVDLPSGPLKPNAAGRNAPQSHAAGSGDMTAVTGVASDLSRQVAHGRHSGREATGVVDVMLGRGGQHCQFLVLELADHLGRRTEHQ
jgi:hypothetical protein